MDWKQKALSMWRDGKSWTETTESLQGEFPDKSHSQLKEKIRGYIRRTEEYKNRANEDGEQEIIYTTQGVSSTKLIDINSRKDITPEELLELHNLDASRWIIDRATNNYWNSQNKDGELLVHCQSKIIAKPVNGLSLEAIEAKFAEMQETYKRPVVKATPRNGKYMVEVNIADLHLGKLCWRGDTGNNFDYKIARDTYYQLINDTIARLQPIKDDIDYIHFVVSNDYFNSDTADKLTTGGTRQDTDVRWQKLFDTGVEMLCSGVDILIDIAPVHIMYTPSNHDEMAMYYAIKFIEAWFRNNELVTFDSKPMPRKYLKYGETLIGYAHGDKIKPAKLASLMAIEAAALWGETAYREFHTAHLHSEHSIVEDNGVIVRRVASPTASDTWHVKSGYVGAVRKAQVFVYDKTLGLLDIMNIPVKA